MQHRVSLKTSSKSRFRKSKKLRILSGPNLGFRYETWWDETSRGDVYCIFLVAVLTSAG